MFAGCFNESSLVNTDPVVIKEIQWTKVFPALHLFKAFGMAFRLRVLVPAMLCVILCDAAWMIAGSWGMEVSHQAEREVRLASFPDSGSLNDRVANRVRNSARDFFLGSLAEVTQLPRPILIAERVLRDGEFAESSVAMKALFLGSILIIGGGLSIAIGHSAAARFCRDTRIGPVNGLRFGCKMIPRWCIAVGLTAAMLLIVRFGLAALLWLGEESSLLRSAISLAALAQTPMRYVLAISLFIAGGAIATDRCDGAESLSRALNYLLSHIVRVAVYFFLVLVIANLAYFVMWNIVWAAHEFLPEGFGNSPSYGEEAVVDGRDYWFVVLPDAVHVGAFFSGVALM